MLYHKCENSNEYKEIISLDDGKCPHCGEYFPEYDEKYDPDLLEKLDHEQYLIDLLKNNDNFVVR